MQKQAFDQRTEQHKAAARSAIVTHEHGVKKHAQRIRKKLKAIEALDWGGECYDCKVERGMVLVCERHGKVSSKLVAVESALDAILYAWKADDEEE